MPTLKQRLKNGEQLLGTMINIVEHTDIVKIFKACDFDYFIVDCEHGGMDYTHVGSMIALAKEMDIGAFVRVPGPLRECILRYMDMGADGLMLPNTNTAGDARLLVEHAKYAPMGNRGISMMRGHNRYVPVPSPVEYMKQANDETILIVQVESGVSVGNIDEIMAVEGIDVAFIGPSDLSHSLGIPGQQDNPLFIESLEKVIAACKKHGKHSGTQGMNAEALKKWMDKGMSFNLYSNEVNMIMNDARAAVGKLRG